jgi:MFS family permease
MFILGATLKKLGYRLTMILGILAYPARFAVWAFFPHNKDLIILVQILHGVCYAFFFVSVYIFAEEYFPKDVRTSAQGLFNVMIFGIGTLVPNCVCQLLAQKTFFDPATATTDFHRMFMIPFGIAIGSALVLALFFHPPKSPAVTGEQA